MAPYDVTEDDAIRDDAKPCDTNVLWIMEWYDAVGDPFLSPVYAERICIGVKLCYAFFVCVW